MTSEERVEIRGLSLYQLLTLFGSLFAILCTVLGAWYSIQNKLNIFGERQINTMERVQALEARNRQVGFTRQDAEEMRTEIMSDIRAIRQARDAEIQEIRTRVTKLEARP